MSKQFNKLFLLLILVLLPLKAHAVCPVCTLAAGVGVGLSRWLGIDDSITGLWIGGLTVCLIILTVNYLDKKNIVFWGYKFWVSIFYYASLLLSFYYLDITGHPLNVLWGVDKLTLGIVFGTLLFIIGITTHNILKKRNNNSSYFPFQKVVLPLLPLAIFSIIFYYITK